MEDKAGTYLGNTVLDHLPHQVEVGLDEPLNDLAVSLFSVIQFPPRLDRYLWQQVDRLDRRHGRGGLGHLPLHHLGDGFVLGAGALLSHNSRDSSLFFRCGQDVAQPVGGRDNLAVLLVLVPGPAPAHHRVLLVAVQVSSVLLREVDTVGPAGLHVSHSVPASPATALRYQSQVRAEY